MKYTLFLLFTFLTLSTSLQSQSKPPLDHSVYDAWQRIANRWLSPDGKYLAYTIDPQEGDNNLIIKSLSTNKSTNIPRGYDATFSKNSQYLIAKIKPTFSQIRQAKIEKKKAEDMPKDSLLICELTSNSIIKSPLLKSFALPEEGWNVLVYVSDKKGVDTTKTKISDSTKTKKPEPNTKEGSTLIIHSLLNGSDLSFNHVFEYALSKKGNSLAFTTSASKKDSLQLPGVFLMNLLSGKIDTITHGSIDAKKLCFNEEGDQLAFVATLDSTTAQVKKYHLRYYQPGMDSAIIRIDNNTPGLKAGWHVSDNGTVRFSKDGTRLLFGTAMIPTPKDTTIPDFEKAQVDVWHYNDDYLQPMQLKTLDQDLKRSYLAVSTQDQLFQQLSDENLENVTISNEESGRYALGRTDKGQRIALQWEGDTKEDIYKLDLKTGIKKLIKDDLDGNASISPEGKYIIWYDNSKRQYYIHDNEKDTTLLLSARIKTPLADEENDMPDDPSSYGISGWYVHDSLVYINDRYDIWSVNPSKLSDVKCITKGYGRKSKTELRRITLDPKARFILPGQTLLLSALQNLDKKRGFYSCALDGIADPIKLIIDEYSFGPVLKAEQADVLTYIKGNYIKSPDIYTSNLLFSETKHSSINPQQQNYNWGTVDLVHWTTFKGHKTEGLLYKPENFDSTKTYPMIVYFYEKLTNGRYAYQPPTPTGSRLNIPFFVSRGYLVFTPDIAYEIGHPGPSAYDYIVSGVNALKKNPWVDKTNIALQGQSWGGYQTLYTITKTNQFKAAWAGAPVVNMFSAYGGIRWESGRNRQMQYEKSQSRLGATPWQRRDLYIENSPLFYLQNITTPLTIMANDADGAVPWYQGIELFTDMRRLDKKIWMLTYNNEGHNLTERRNQKDISIREQQFFDHYLKGAPMPEWMDTGVKATEKGKTWGLGLKKS
ncbi:MAG: prolyl oligopeptidase family serine peptidase [Saprospiraceae bacterium]